MATASLVLLINQASQVLDVVAPQIKEEANKKITEIKQKIPTEATVRQMMMDEITSRGAELVCSPEMRDRIDGIFNKFKGLIDKLKNITDKVNEKINKIQDQLARINKIIERIRGIFNILTVIAQTLPTIIIAAKVGIKFLTGLAANGAVTVKLKDLIDKSKSRIEEYKNTIKVFEKRIEKILKATQIPSMILTLAKNIISITKAKLDAIMGLVESYYLKHTLMCDVEGNSMEDEDFAIAVNEATNNLEGLDGSVITFIEEDLLPSTIERIRNAKFEVIQYRIA
jgi:DNA repair exonuclease SbcCD ATPase subunit